MSFSKHLESKEAKPHMSFVSDGPSAESYKPPAFGRFKSSSRIGLTICLTEIRRMSSVVRKEKDRLVIREGTEWEIFMLSEYKPRGTGRD